ncbi:MAG TPA: hypothetical protein VFN21_13140 [Acidimicrobiales bacterium]|nr:hypothetical protein [Acidimicrobiales bacterium]
MLAAALHELTPPLLAGGAVTLVLWGLLVLVLAFRTRPQSSEVRRAGLELGGDEPPAVAGLLVDDWRPPVWAADATLVDLVARDVLDLERQGDGRSWIRLIGPAPAELAPHERTVYDLIARRAVGGEVPLDALTLGDGRAARAWTRHFGTEVRDEARRRGLSRARYGAATRFVVAATATLPAGLIALGIGSAATGSDAPPVRSSAVSATSASVSASGDVLGPLVLAFMVGLLVWIALVAVFKQLPTDRDTPEGLEHAARWAGLQANLGEDTVFASRPVGAVAIWDRLLAYGVALGVAEGAARDVPLHVQSRNEAWSHVTGRWRLVKIRYPRWVPPGWGSQGDTARRIGRSWTIGGVIGGVLAVIALVADVGGTLSGGEAWQDNTASGVARTIAGWSPEILGVVSLAVAARGVTMWVLGARDCREEAVVEGEVLRLVESRVHVRTIEVFGPPSAAVERQVEQMEAKAAREQRSWRAAVDDGSTDEIRAWRTRGPTPAGVTAGARVRATVGPNLGGVRDLVVVEPAPPTPPVGTDDSVAPGPF